MQHDAPARLYHILEAGDSILTITAGKTFDDYKRERVLRLAVERLFTILGEALNEAVKTDHTIAPRITAFRRIIGFRNILVHGYADIFDEMVWQRIEDDLPILLREVRALLAESAPPPGSGGLPA